MMTNENINKKLRWFFFLGLLIVMFYLLRIIYFYEELVARPLVGSSKVKFFRAIIRRLDHDGGRTYVLIFFALIGTFFLYKFISSFRKNDENNESVPLSENNIESKASKPKVDKKEKPKKEETWQGENGKCPACGCVLRGHEPECPECGLNLENE